MYVESIIKDEVIIPLLLPLKCINEFDNPVIKIKPDYIENKYIYTISNK